MIFPAIFYLASTEALEEHIYSILYEIYDHIMQIAWVYFSLLLVSSDFLSLASRKTLSRAFLSRSRFDQNSFKNHDKH